MTDAEAAALIARLRDEQASLPATHAQAIVAVRSGTGAVGLDVGLTPEGLLAIALPAPAQEPVFPIELRAILVTVLDQALVVRDGIESRENVVVVVCNSTEEPLMRWFARVAVSLLAPATDRGAAASLTTSILQLAQLFELAQRPGRKAVIGLWAELAVIAAARDRLALLAAWRERAAEPFDFGAGDERLEVKARSSASLAHHFSAEQLRPAHHRAWVVVVPVQRQGGGESIHDLAETLRRDAIGDAALLAKIDRVILECLGSSYAGAVNERFDLGAAREGLTLYEASAIPCVAMPLPEGVLSARLQVDLAYVPTADPAALPGPALARMPFSSHV